MSTPITDSRFIRIATEEIPVTDTFDDRDDLIVTLEHLPVGKLCVDAGEDGYQRIAWPHAVEKITTKFDPNLFDPLMVSLRDDGSYWVIDGHHRLEAARVMGMRTVPCRLIYGLTREEEAELFTKAAKGRRQIEAFDKLRADLAARHEDAIAYKKCLLDQGFMPDAATTWQGPEINPDRKYPIRAVDGTRKVWAIDKGKTLSTVLAIIRETWSQTEPKFAVRATFISGMARVISRYEDIDIDKLGRELKKTSPSVIIGQAVGRGNAMGVNQNVALATIIVEMYNKRIRREDDKLPIERVL